MRNSQGSIRKVVILTYISMKGCTTSGQGGRWILQTQWSSPDHPRPCTSWSRTQHSLLPPHKADPFGSGQSRPRFSAPNPFPSSRVPASAWQRVEHWQKENLCWSYLAIAGRVSSTSQEPSTRSPGGGEVTTSKEWLDGSGLSFSSQTGSAKYIKQFS